MMRLIASLTLFSLSACAAYHVPHQNYGLLDHGDLTHGEHFCYETQHGVSVYTQDIPCPPKHMVQKETRLVLIRVGEVDRKDFKTVLAGTTVTFCAGTLLSAQTDAKGHHIAVAATGLTVGATGTMWVDASGYPQNWLGTYAHEVAHMVLYRTKRPYAHAPDDVYGFNDFDERFWHHVEAFGTRHKAPKKRRPAHHND